MANPGSNRAEHEAHFHSENSISSEPPYVGCHFFNGQGIDRVVAGEYAQNGVPALFCYNALVIASNGTDKSLVDAPDFVCNEFA